MASEDRSSSPGWVSILVGLIVGVLVGHFVWPQKEKATERPPASFSGLGGANVVYIGPTAETATPESLPISIANKDVVYWKPWSLGSGHKVTIRFPHDKYPPDAQRQPPFVNGKVGEDQVIQCEGETCFSYGINKALNDIFNSFPPGKERTFTYEYIQTLDDKTPADGRIIIKQGP
ncbi:MAG TPA: hypothetical protein VMN82_06510 [Thermoanaerobaculia bacterium]|nr:hypothetical protein [Thermoanaerobaculia bacterium]